ncbi:MAG TPA: type II toxin-antitoxin system VapC family toxin [Candidatus Sulfotelmatobacter sp.]|nr:type II toxin-antitoxin system VapC family toxin [Candidatus Sulfotelmatobacter sp.]
MILLDTHVLVWAVSDSRILSRTAASAIRRARRQDGIAISSISIWELAYLFARGRIVGHGSIEASLGLLLENVVIRPITPEIAALATQFPDNYPRDPADRIIGGTARAEGLVLITRDENIRRSPLLKTLW